MNIKDKNIIMLDIDGTVKDLVKENTDSLVRAMKYMNNFNLKLRGKLVLTINKINMYFIKTGLLPTNLFMQKMLLLIYSILLFKRYVELKNAYFSEYNREHIFFEGVAEKINKTRAEGKLICMVTKNSQNESILKCKGIKSINLLSICKSKRSKYYIYKYLIDIFSLPKENIIIVGDNLWDDVIPALMLGVDVYWCNRYANKTKKIVAKVLKLFIKKIHYEK